MAFGQQLAALAHAALAQVWKAVEHQAGWFTAGV
jgi:hypothetical protein